jgi:hypothetical protein
MFLEARPIEVPTGGISTNPLVLAAIAGSAGAATFRQVAAALPNGGPNETIIYGVFANFTAPNRLVAAG